MKDRREFLKNAATGAVLLGTQSKLGLAAMLAQHTETGKSRVVVARDAALHGTGSQLDEMRVLALLDRAMASYTGREKPVEAWKRIIPANILKDKVIGLKVNGLGGRGISTHAALVQAICERLQQAGVGAGNIVAWDRNARDLRACGLTINTDRSKVRCYGSDVAGFEEQQESWGVARIRLSKILTRECAMVINLPILKDHEMAGMTFSMKNMYGVVDRPDSLHADNCNPGVADLNCIAAIREKVTLTIGDAMSSVYQGGPGFRPEYLWYPNALIVGEDRVAVDHTAWQMLDRKRVEAGLLTLEAAGRAPRYIETAADAAHKLGVNGPQRIRLIEV
ncbi:MAG TPA: DUF362 domain-containing protein [Terracidiphilus sp.]|nr:DUF362 domain-containing protein [Terracidiphilus sp.]